jgi:hypothetical protein
MVIKYVVLDLDETLVSVGDSNQCLNFGCPKHYVFRTDKGYNYYLHKRPFLDDFLDGLDKLKLTPIVFSAGGESYVTTICNIIFDARKTKLLAILDANSLTRNSQCEYVKEMDTVAKRTGKNKEEMIGLDDSIEHFANDNRYIIKRWYHEQSDCYDPNVNYEDESIQDNSLMEFLEYLELTL